MTVALFLISIFYILYSTSGSLMNTIEDSLGKIEVFLKDIDDEKTESVKNSIILIDGVKSVDYISKEDAVDKAKEVSNVMIEGVPKDIFPASFIVTIDDFENANSIIMKMREIDGVGDKEEDIQVMDGLDFVNKVAVTVRVVAFTIFLITSVSSCFIVMNSIKLMLYARRKEISIMKYVGATDLFTKAPFVIEGLFMALIGATIVALFSSMICDGLYNAASQGNGAFAFLSSTSELKGRLFMILFILATGIGTIGSSVSINKYLDV